MRTFRRVVELGGFTAAGRDLGLSSAAVSKHMSELEAHLRTSLMARTTRRISLTEAGQVFFDHCRRILDAVDAAEGAVSALADGPRGRLRINAPMSFGTLQLAPALPDFLKSYPELQLDLALNDKTIDLVEEGFDIAVRIRTELPSSSLIARRIAPIPRVACAAPAYLEEAGVPRAPRELATHRCLVYSLAVARQEWQFHRRRDASPVAVEVDGWFTANNSVALRQAALAGLGVALMPSFVVEEDLRASRLIALFDAYEPVPHHLFALCPPHHTLAAKTRVFIDFLVERFGRALS